MEIFCPNDHLVLNASSCDKCDWQRPVSGKVGVPIWGPVDVLAGLGGESRDRILDFTHLGSRLFLAPRSNEVVAISVIDGKIIWRHAIAVGKKIVSLLQHSGKVFVVLQDTHSLLEGGCGSIELLDPENGALTPYWTASSHDLTPPLFWQDRFFVRTAASKLYALETSNPEHILWQKALKAWWATNLVLAGETLALIDGNAMVNEGFLEGVDVNHGRTIWTHPLDGKPSKPLCVDQQRIYVLNGKKSLLAVSALSGEDIWRRNFSHFYSPPLVVEDHLVLVVRGNEDAKAADHYLLVSLNSGTGETEWQQPCPSRTRIKPLYIDSKLITGGDDGIIRAFSLQNGSPLWQYQLGHAEDPIQTQIYPLGDKILAGTYFGQLAAITVQEPQEFCGSPECYLEKEEWNLAADSYALQGEWIKAADIYAYKLKHEVRACQLYEKGKDYKSAGRLALENGHFSQALEYFRLADDPEGEIDALLSMGNYKRAAEKLVQLGKLLPAAELLESKGDFTLASQYYLEVGRNYDYLRLLLKTPLKASEIAKLRESGDYETAAAWEMNNKQYDAAALDFRNAGKEKEELGALKILQEQTQESTEAWVWQRIAELSEGLGDLLTAANAWLKVDRPENAGILFLQMADSLASSHPTDFQNLPAKVRIEIATRYQQAADAFNKEGLITEREESSYKARMYNLEPKVMVVDAKSSGGFREMEWNEVTLTVQNIGFGRAMDVMFNIGESRFEVDEQSRIPKFNLAAGRTYPTQVLKIRPLKDQKGEAVPLDIKWCWKGANGKEYSDGFSHPLKVVAILDPQSTSGSVTIYDYSKHEGSVNINKTTASTGARQIQLKTEDGEQANSSSQRKSDEDRQYEKICPNCGSRIPSQAKICIQCQFKQSVE